MSTSDRIAEERKMNNKKTELKTQKGRLGLRLLVVLVLAVAWAVPANAQKVVRPNGAGGAGAWKLLGTVNANFRADHDTIVVRGPFDNFRRVKFKVTNAPLNLRHLVVTYDNGQPDRIEVRQNIPQGGQSRQIDLRGVGKRSIRRIDFWYDTKGVLKGKANVTVFGMK